MKPNIIWIFGDQHRAQATGYMGDPNARTPNIDRMAAQGVPFYHAISGCPWCTPFRGALMTSRYV
ncbi:MAG: sulfatase-like hydrolase/transferase, partial [Candidatus Latescibacterota bacterium]